MCYKLYDTETYRSGRNGADSKSVYRFNTGTRVRIPPSPLKTPQTIMSEGFYMCITGYNIRLDAKCSIERDNLFSVLKSEVFC